MYDVNQILGVSSSMVMDFKKSRLQGLQDFEVVNPGC